MGDDGGMSDIEDLQKKIRTFNEERDWSQYHNTKDLALSVVLEAAELLEKYQWKSEKQIREYEELHKEEIGEEVADVIIYILNLSDKLGLNVKEIVEDKIEKNDKKYPVDKAKGSSKKYTEYE